MYLYNNNSKSHDGACLLVNTKCLDLLSVDTTGYVYISGGLIQERNPPTYPLETQ